MIASEIRQSLENQQRVLVIIWVAFIFSLVIYLFIPEIVFPKTAPLVGDLFSDPIRTVLWAATLVAIGVLFWWRKRYLTKEALLERLAQRRAAAVFSDYLGRKIVGFAIAESVAFFGLLLVFAGRYFWDQYLFSVISAVLLILEFPSKVFLEEFMKEVEGKGLE